VHLISLEPYRFTRHIYRYCFIDIALTSQASTFIFHVACCKSSRKWNQLNTFPGSVFLIGAISQWPIGKLSDMYDRRKVIIIVTFAAAFFALCAIFASGSKGKMTKGFGPKVEGFDQVPFADHEAIKKAINKNTAAIMIETIMGEGGIKVIPDYCLKGLRKLCNKKKINLNIELKPNKGFEKENIK